MPKRDNKKAAASRPQNVVRKQMAAEQRRKKIVWGSVAGLLVIGMVGLITWMVLLDRQHNQVHTPAAANSAGNGIVTGSGTVTVEDYIDFMCPHCKAFHDEASTTIAQLVAENKITLVQHPVAYLDGASTTQYSTRSSAASACASDGGKFNEFSDLLFANQPAEGSAGLTDDQLIALGAQAGLGDSFKDCVKDKRYQTWAKKVSDDATKAGITGTPTVLVNGKKVQASSTAVLAAIEAASGASSGGTAEPTPTPSES